MAALLSADGTVPITCRICGEPIPLAATFTDEHSTGTHLTATLTVDGTALRAHLLLTHGVRGDD